MGKFKIAVSFDTKFLNSLRGTEKSGVEIQRSKHHLALHPIQSNNFNESIKELLNEKVAKYSKDLNGILLGYQNIKLLSGEGMLHDDSCYIHCDIEADFFVFRPEVGEEMQGVVIRKSKDHVGLLVYNTFNVSIPAPQDQDIWQGKHVEIGYEVSFRIVHFSFTSYLPYIKGELISILSDVDSGVSSENTSSQKVKKKANKKIVFDDDSPSQELPDKELDESPKKKKSKKDKSRRSDGNKDLSFSENIENGSIDNEELEHREVTSEPSESPKKRKSKDKSRSSNSNNDFSFTEKIESESKDNEESHHDVTSEYEESPKRKKLKKEKISEKIECELEDEDESLSINNGQEKRTRRIKPENIDWVDDFESFLNESENKITKKRKNSVSETSESPKKKKKKHL